MKVSLYDPAKLRRRKGRSRKRDLASPFAERQLRQKQNSLVPLESSPKKITEKPLPPLR
jgi:hypothetical protein